MATGLDLALSARTEHDDDHPTDSDGTTDQVPTIRGVAIDQPEPGHRDGDIDAAVRRVNPARRSGMEREQPREQREGERAGNEQPRGTILAQPEIRQITADDLGDRRCHEEKCRLDQNASFRLESSGLYPNTGTQRKCERYENTSASKLRFSMARIPRDPAFGYRLRMPEVSGDPNGAFVPVFPSCPSC